MRVLTAMAPSKTKRTSTQQNTIKNYFTPKPINKPNTPPPANSNSSSLPELTPSSTRSAKKTKENNTRQIKKLVLAKPKTAEPVSTPPKTTTDLSSPHSTVLGLASSVTQSQDEIIQTTNLPKQPMNNTTSSLDQHQNKTPSLPKQTQPKNTTTSPLLNHLNLSSPSSLSSLGNTSPSNSSTPPPAPPPPPPPKEVPALTSEDLDDLALEDEWLNQALESKTVKKPTEINPQTPVATTSHVNTTSSAQPTRRSERINDKTNCLTVSAPPKSATIIKLRRIQPLIPSSKNHEKFSMSSIVKDQHQRQERQANLIKRKREEFDHFDLNQLPTQLNLDSIQITPKKKINLNQRDNLKNLTDHHDKKHTRSTTTTTTTTTNHFNSIFQNEHQGSPNYKNNMNDNEEDDRDPSDVFNSPSRLKILKEDMKTCVVGAGGVHKLIEQDIQTGQLAGLNRGSQFRQVFHSSVFKPIDKLTSKEDRISFEMNYSDINGVSMDQNVVDFVKFIIDNLNYSIEDPDFLSLDLMDCIPDELTKTSRPDEEEIKITTTHQAIFSILFEQIINPKFPTQIVQTLVFLINSYMKHIDSSRTLNGSCRQWGDFWLEKLQKSLIKLGFLNHLIYFDEFNLNKQEQQPQQEEEDESDIGIDFNTRIERIRCILILFNFLSMANHLHERARRWTLIISMRIGVEPSSSFKLRAEVTTNISEILNRIITPIGILPQPSNQQHDKENNNDRMMKKEDINKLVIQVLRLGIYLNTWTNILELIRLIPNHFQFRKFISMGFLDLVSYHPHFDANLDHHHQHQQEEGEEGRSNEKLDRVLPKMARWLTHISNKFINPPPAREIYNSIRHVFKRPYEEESESDNESENEEQVEQIQGQDNINNNNNNNNTDKSKEKIKKNQVIKKMKKGSKEKFRLGFEMYLKEEEEEEEEGLNEEGVKGGKKKKKKKKKMMNETQFKDMIEIFNSILIGIWDYLIDFNNRDQVKTCGYSNNTQSNTNTNSVNYDSSITIIKTLTSYTNSSASGNVWIKLVNQSLIHLDSKISSNVSPQVKAERIKLKNSIYRLACCLDFLNQESFLLIKGIDSKGQFKLDKFFIKK